MEFAVDHSLPVALGVQLRGLIEYGVACGQLMPGDRLPSVRDMWLRPTLEINGLWGGYQGPGTKTVIPCEAHAKITCRLVPGQRPDDIVAGIAAHLQAHCPRGVTVDVRPGDHGSEAYEIPGQHPGLALAEQILEEVYEQKALRVRMSGPNIL